MGRATDVDSDTLPASADTPPRRGGDATRDAPPSMVGRFEITAKLGEGGMGVVLLAVDPTLGRRVAIKVLHRGDQALDAARRRLVREAQGIAQLTHENVVVVHEVGMHGAQVYVAMEYVEGGTLKRWQAGRGWREILAAYVRAGRGLAAAHDAGLVHRDFKPDNVLVGDDGRVRVTDFGLVLSLDGTDDERSPTVETRRRALELGASLTQSGALLGTPRYMAPEQHLGEGVDARADQFAFCVALYEALYGRPPFAGTTYAMLTSQVLAGDVATVPATSPVPAVVRDAILRGLARDRDQRHPTTRALLAELERGLAAAEPPATRPRRWRWVAAAIAIVVLAAVLALVATRDGGRQRDLLDEQAATLADPSASAEARAAAAALLAGSTDPRATAALTTALRGDGDLEGRAIAARALAPYVTAAASTGTALPATAGARPWADGVSEEQQAEAFRVFSRANQRLAGNEIEESVPLYREALRQWNHPAIHYNLALALANLQQPVEMREALDAAMRYGGAPLEPEQLERARAFIVLLDRELGRVELTVGDATLVLDGKDVFIGPGTFRARVSPGIHEVATRANGTLSAPRRLTVRAGETAVLAVGTRS